MKRLFLILLVALTLTGLGMIALNTTQPPSRGKVVSSDGSGSLEPQFKIYAVADVHFVQDADTDDMENDSTEMIEGEICVLDEDGNTLDERIPIVPRRFPKWFTFGCEEEGDFALYNVIRRNGRPLAVINGFERKED